MTSQSQENLRSGYELRGHGPITRWAWARLLAWTLSAVALALAMPVGPISTAGAMGTAPLPSSQQLPEEDHHETTTTVVKHAQSHRKARRLRLAAKPYQPLVLPPSLRGLHRALDVERLAIEGDAFALKLHRAELPRRTGPSDGDASLS